MDGDDPRGRAVVGVGGGEGRGAMVRPSPVLRGSRCSPGSARARRWKTTVSTEAASRRVSRWRSRGKRYSRLAQEHLGHAQVELRRHLEVLPRRGDDPHGAAHRLDQRGVVGGGGDHRVVLVERALEGGAAEDLRRLDRPQRASGRACARRARRAHSLIVSVTGAAAIAASASPSASRHACDELGRDAAGERRRGRRPRRRRAAAAASAARTECERSLPRARRWCRPAPRPRRQRDDDLGHGRHPLQRGDRPLDHRTAGQDGERLGDRLPKAFATTRGHDERDRQYRSYAAATFAPADSGEQVVEMLLGLVLVLVERVHQLGGEDLLGPGEHLLLTRRQALVDARGSRGCGRPRRARRCRRS